MWYYKNKAFHDALSFNALQVSQHINKVSFEHFTAWNQVPAHVERWIPPVFPSYKLNFDTAIRDIFSAQAMVCRNHQGCIIHMISQISLPCLSNYGETLAACLTTSLASSLNFNNFIIKGDS
jgi:hypothetical protein